MNVQEIPIKDLFVSQLNVRKILESSDDETGIKDLALDIDVNGLINPLTVRKNGDRFEIIAGQRRFLACQQNKMKSVPCNVVDVSSQKAEELSLVENVQRNAMTYQDKVKTYNKLYQVYKGDIDKVSNVVHISRATLLKYIRLSSLPDNVLTYLDAGTDNKITLDVAVELTKLPPQTDKIVIIRNIQTLTTQQKISAIREFVQGGFSDAGDIQTIKEDIAIAQNNIQLAPSCPYVIDANGNYIIIPKNLYGDVVTLIQSRS